MKKLSLILIILKIIDLSIVPLNNIWNEYCIKLSVPNMYRAELISQILIIY